MKGLKVFLFIHFIFFLVYALLNLFMPAQVAEWKIGPADAVSARYNGATYLTLFLAALYAFRNPTKNVAIVSALVFGDVLVAVVGLWHGFAGAETWSASLFSIIVGLVLALGLIIFYPRGEKTA